MRPTSRNTIFSLSDSSTILRIILAIWCNKDAVIDASTKGGVSRDTDGDFSAIVGFSAVRLRCTSVRDGMCMKVADAAGSGRLVAFPALTRSAMRTRGAADQRGRAGSAFGAGAQNGTFSRR